MPKTWTMQKNILPGFEDDDEKYCENETQDDVIAGEQRNNEFEQLNLTVNNDDDDEDIIEEETTTITIVNKK
eukprot:UN33533